MHRFDYRRTLVLCLGFLGISIVFGPVFMGLEAEAVA